MRIEAGDERGGVGELALTWRDVAAVLALKRKTKISSSRVVDRIGEREAVRFGRRHRALGSVREENARAVGCCGVAQEKVSKGGQRPSLCHLPNPFRVVESRRDNWERR